MSNQGRPRAARASKKIVNSFFTECDYQSQPGTPQISVGLFAAFLLPLILISNDKWRMDISELGLT